MEKSVIEGKKKHESRKSYVLIISVIFLAVMVVLSMGFSYYNHKRINAIEQNIDIISTDISKKLMAIDQDIIEGHTLVSKLQSNLSSLGTSIYSNINNLNNKFESSQKKHQQEMTALNSMISEIEEQSNIKLDEVKDELKNIKVKSKDFSAIIEDVLQSVVIISTNDAQGSGAVISTDGFVVTNYHVVEDATRIRVSTYDRNVYDGKLVGYNKTVDIAVVKINANVQRLKFADSDNVKVGERVIALGSPAGLSFTVTEGIVSAMHRKGPNNLPIYIQTDVPLNKGNSGGPLVNTDGKIIGINNFKVGGYEGLGFALESNVAKEVAEKIINI